MSTIKKDVVLVKIMQDVVKSMKSPVSNPINYEPGRSIQILDSLQANDNSISYKGFKYPLVAMLLPIDENRGRSGYYATANIPRIVFATHVSSFDGVEYVLDKYGANGTFTTILYPMYNEFLRCLAIHPEIIGMDVDAFIHTKRDNPCQQPIGQGLSDYVDTMEILGLEIILNQIKNCI